MTEEQLDRIARLLYRISDSNERDEVTREIGKVLAEAAPAYNEDRFYRLSNVKYLEER